MTTATSVATKARALTDPDTTALANAPERPEDIPAIAREDWEALVDAVLDKARGSRLDMPMPQLLLRIANHLTRLAENDDHLKTFVAGNGRDQEDLAGSMHKRMVKAEKAAAAADMKATKLERRVEQLEAALTAPVDASTVQALNP